MVTNGTSNKPTGNDTSEKPSPSKSTSLLGKISFNIEEVISFYWSGLIVGFMALWITIEILARLSVNFSFYGIPDIVALLMVVLTFTSLSGVQRNKAHIRMDLLPNKLSGRSLGILETVNLLFGVVAAIIVFFAGTSYVLTLYEGGAVTEAVRWPLWTAGIFLPIGCLLLLLRLGVHIKQYFSTIF